MSAKLFSSLFAISSFSALAFVSFSSNTSFDVLQSDSSSFNVSCFGKYVLFHGFVNNHCGIKLSHGGCSNNLVISEIPNQKVGVIQVSINVDIVVGFGKSGIAETFIVESSPEERNIVIGNLFSEHIQSCKISLVYGFVVMFNSDLLSSVPPRIGSDISCGVNIGLSDSSVENISFDTSILR